jgi:protein-S-isoprenylcysteine O-methyltransferase Ste14
MGMDSLELKVPPPLQMAVGALLLWIVARLFPGFDVQMPFRLFIASGLLILGGAIAVSGVVAFRRHETTINPLRPDRSAVVVRTGIFRYSRNPMYLGMLVVLVGVAVLVSNVLAGLLVLPLFVWTITRIQIVPEERVLRQKFQNEYEIYLKEVRRWL